MRKRTLLCALLLGLLFFGPGCWDRSEIEELAIVRAMAVDYLPGRQSPYLVTLAVQRPAPLAGGGEGGGGGEQPTVLFSGVGATIDLAIQQAGFSLSRRVFLSHNEVVIVGEELARHGMQHVLDFIVRNHEMRLSNFLLVAEGTGQEILSVKERLEGGVSDEILALIARAEETAEADPQETYKFMRSMATPGQEPHTSLIRVGPPLEAVVPELKEEAAAGGGKKQGGGGAEDILTLSGMAVFRGDKLAGKLTFKETRGYHWLIGNAQGFVAIEDPIDPKHSVSLFVNRISTRIKPVIAGDALKFRIEVEEEGDIASQTSLNNLSTAEAITKINSAKAAVLKYDVEKALGKLQELETDIVGFGTILNRKDHKTFGRHAQNWPEFFRDLEIEVHVVSQIRRTGQLSRPVRITR